MTQERLAFSLCIPTLMNIYREVTTQSVDDSQARSVVSAFPLFASCQLSQRCYDMKKQWHKRRLVVGYTQRCGPQCLGCKQACVRLRNMAGTQNSEGSKQRRNQTAARARISPANRETSVLRFWRQRRAEMTGDDSRDSHVRQKFHTINTGPAVQRARRQIIPLCLTV